MLQKINPLFLLNANRVRMGYSLAFILLLLSLWLTSVTVQKLVRRSEAVDRTHAVIINLETLMSNIKDAETGFRGYVIIKDSIFLEPYYGSQNRADSVLTVLQGLMSDNIVQLKRIGIVKEIMKRRYYIISNGLAMFNNNQKLVSDSMKPFAYNGKNAMDSIRSNIMLMQTDEKGLLMRRSAEIDGSRAAVQIINIATIIVAVLLAFYSFFTFNKENRGRQLADEKAADYRKRLEERVQELRTANAELILLRRNEKFAATGRIARTIAHEVRNPLTNINLAVEQLKEEIGQDNEDQHSMLDMIIRNSTRINQLVTDLLDSTRFSELKYEQKSINDLADEALEMAADRIQLNHITINKEYSTDICDVLIDPEKIKIAFLNIIVNAIEAMEPGKGVLTIRTAGENDQCVVYIKDNGIGMDDEAQQKLFEPYFTSKPKGNGLGMTNTQNIILNHNGSISVESTPGVGTTFIIALRFPQT